MEFKEGLTFDDVLLVPKYSDITSRTQTDLTTQLSRNISLNIPFVSANMDTVTESSMAVAIARAGGIGIIHRFLTIEEQADEVLKVKRSGSVIIENPYSITADKTIEDALDYAENQDISGQWFEIETSFEVLHAGFWQMFSNFLSNCFSACHCDAVSPGRRSFRYR